MTTCLKPVVINGETFLAIDSTQSNLSACAYVVEDGANSGFSALFNLSIEDALVISTAIAFLWAVAYGFRVIAKFLSSDDGVQHQD